MENKWNAVAMHWRGISMYSALVAEKCALNLLTPFAQKPGMQILQFDGGIELRAGRRKGEAIRILMGELRADTPVAYLGDDATDEDAFEALGDRGLGVLVRRRCRPGAAHVWLHPPDQLRNFLATWLRAGEN